MKVFYHKNCADGMSAAAIVLKYAEEKINEEAFLYGITHGEEFPIDVLEKNEEVFIVDYYVKPEIMDVILDIGCKVTWIDHHVTAQEIYKDYNNLDKTTVIYSDKRCASYLTWKYLYPGKKIPTFLKYIDDHDRFAGLYAESSAFRRGLLLYSQLTPNNKNYWKPLLEGGDKELQQTLRAGQILESNRDLWLRKNKGYELIFEGLKVLVLNRSGNSESFKYIDNGNYDALMTWMFDGKEYKYNLYGSKRGTDKIDLSAIAVKYGGGGHKNACGFSSINFLADPR